MATPIRQLVRKALSPRGLSPNILKSPNSPRISNKLSPTFVQTRSTGYVNCLQYSNSTKKLFDKYLDEDLGISVLNSNIDTRILTNSEPDSKNRSFEYENSALDIKLFVPPKSDLPLVNTPDRFEILRLGLSYKSSWKVLGKGSYGTVVQAIYKGEKVAIKIVPKKQFSTLTRENNALKLNHKNIVKTIKVVCEPSNNYSIVIMQDCSVSESMQSHLDNFDFELQFRTIIKWALDICYALKHCHEQGILHLDIKPKNILVEKELCKLCDFGNSLDIFDSLQLDNLHQGTVAYTAPEIFRDERPHFPADIYALGITLWQMQSRKIPYKEIDNKDSVIYFVVKHDLRPSPIDGDTRYCELYTKCWAGNSSLRPSLVDIISSLKNML